MSNFKTKNAPNSISVGGSAPDPAWRAYSAPPSPLSWIQGVLLLMKGREGEEWIGGERKVEERGR